MPTQVLPKTYAKVRRDTNLYTMLNRYMNGPSRWREALPKIAELMNVEELKQYVEHGKKLLVSEETANASPELQKAMKKYRGLYTPKLSDPFGKKIDDGFKKISEAHDLDYPDFNTIMFFHEMNNTALTRPYDKLTVQRIGDDYYMHWSGSGEGSTDLDSITKAEWLTVQLEAERAKEEEAQ